MRIATFNVNSIRSRMDILKEWLPASGVDALAVQETKVRDEEFPTAEIEQAGYSVVYRGEKSYNGVAIISKAAPDEVIHGFTDGLEPLWDTRLIAARFNDIWLLNTYVPQGKSIEHADYTAKKEFLRRTAAFVEKHIEEKLVWVGDLNVAPTEIDVTNPSSKKDHVCFVKELRDLFTELTSPLTDCFRKHHEGERLYSFFDYRVKNAVDRNIGWRIDHILATPSLASRCTACWIDLEPRKREKPSDHTPMLADFE